MESNSFYVFYPFVAGFGGIERLIVDLYRHLEGNSKHLNLISFRNCVDFSQYGAASLGVDCIRCHRNLVSECMGLRQYIRTNEIDPSRVLVMEIRGAVYASFAIPSGYNVHIADPPSLLGSDLTKYSFTIGRLYSDFAANRTLQKRFRGQAAFWLSSRAVKRAKSLITMTQRNVNELEAAYNRKFAVVPPGVQLPSRQVTKVRQSGLVRFLSVCRLEPSKRVDAIILAFSRLVEDSTKGDSVVDAHLTIVGGGSQSKALHRLAMDCGVATSIEFRGMLTEPELEAAYRDADIFVMPAKQGYGLPGLESLARGLDLIVHQDSGVAEFLADYPQVQIINNLEDSLLLAMKRAARREQDSIRIIPPIPTSDDWASSVCELSGW